MARNWVMGIDKGYGNVHFQHFCRQKLGYEDIKDGTKCFKGFNQVKMTVKPLEIAYRIVKHQYEKVRKEGCSFISKNIPHTYRILLCKCRFLVAIPIHLNADKTSRIIPSYLSLKVFLIALSQYAFCFKNWTEDYGFIGNT